MQLRELRDTKPTPKPDWLKEMAYTLTEAKAAELRRKQPRLTFAQAFDQAIDQMDADTKRALIRGSER